MQLNADVNYDIEITGLDRAFALLQKFETTMLNTAKAAFELVGTMQTLSTVFGVISGISLKTVSGEIAALGKAFNVLGTQFNNKGVQTLIDNKSIPALVAALTPFIDLINKFPDNFDKLGNLGLALQKVSVVFNDKNFATAPANLRKLGTAFEKVAEIFSKINIPQAPIDSLQKLFVVLEEFMKTRGEKNIGPILQAIATGILTVDGALKNSTVLNNPAQLTALQGLATALKILGQAFERFGKSFQTADIASNFFMLINQFTSLYDAIAKIPDVKGFSEAMSAVATGVGDLSKAFRSITIGKYLDKLDGNTQLLLKFINDLATIDAAPIIAKLQPLSEVIRNLADAGRAIGALKGIDTVKAQVTALGVEVTKTNALSNSIARGFKNAVSKIAKDLLLLTLKPFTDALKGAIVAVQKFSFALIKLPFKIILAPLKLLPVLLKAVAIGLFEVTKFALKAAVALLKIPFKIVIGGFQLLTRVIGGTISVMWQFVAATARLVGSIATLGTAFNRSATGKFGKDTKDAKNSVDQLAKEVDISNISIDKLVNRQNEASASGRKLSNSFTVASIAASVMTTAVNIFTGQSLGKMIASVASVAVAMKTFDVARGILSGFGRTAVQVFKQVSSQILGAIGEYEGYTASLVALQAKELVDTNPEKFTKISDALDTAKEKSKELIAYFKKLGEQSPFESGEIINAFKQLQAFNFNTSDAKALVATLVDYASALNLSAADISELATIFGQIGAAGKLLGQDMKQLTMRGIGVSDALKDAGISLSDAREGVVGMDKVIIAIVNSMNKDFAGSAKRLSNTVNGLTSTFAELKKSIMIDLFTPVVDSLKPFVALAFEFVQSSGFKDYIAQLAKTMEANVIPAVKFTIGVFRGFFILMNDIPDSVKTFIGTLLNFAIVLSAATVASALFSSALLLISKAWVLMVNPASIVIGAIAGIATVIYQHRAAIGEFFSKIKEGFAYLPGIISKAIEAIRTDFAKLGPIFERIRNGFSNILRSVASYGANIVVQLANGITSAIGLVVKALQKIGQVITYWLKPGSPPKLLPELDKWGSEAATVYLEGFNDADYSSINDFGKTLGSLLSSVGVVDVDTRAITQMYAQALSDINSGQGVDTDSLFSSITALAPQASNDINTLVQKYIELAKITQNASTATAEYDAALAGLEGTITGLDNIDESNMEEKQILRLDRISKSAFITEDQRQKALRDIEKIRATQQLRQLKIEKEQADATLENSTAEIDLLKQRIDLANEFQTPVELFDETALDNISDKLDKIKDIKEDFEAADIGDLGLSGIEESVNGIDLAFTKLEKSINISRDAITNFYDTMMIKLLVAKQQFLTAITETKGFNIISALLGFDIADLPTSVGRIIGTIDNNLERIRTFILTKLLSIKVSIAKGETVGDAISLAFTGIDIEGNVALIGKSMDKLAKFVKEDLGRAFTEGFNSADGNIALGLVKGIQGVANAILETGPIQAAITTVKTQLKAMYESLRDVPILGVFLSMQEITLEGIGLVANILRGKGISESIDIFIANTEAAFKRLASIPGMDLLIKTFSDLKELFSNFKMPEFELPKLITGDMGLEFISAIVTAFEFIKQAVISVSDAFANFSKGETMTALVPFFRELATLIGNIVIAIGAVVAAIIVGLGPEIDGMIADILEIATSIMAFINDTVKALLNIGNVGFFETVKTIFSSLFTNIFSIFGNIDSLASHIVDIIPNILNFVSKLTGIDFSGFLWVFEKLRFVFEFFISNILFGWLGKLLGLLGKLFSFGGAGAGGGFIAFITKIGDELAKFAGPLLTGVVNGIKRIVTYFAGLITAFRTMGDDMAMLFSAPDFGGIVAFFFRVIDAVKYFADDFIKWIKIIPTAIGDIFNSFFAGGFSTFFTNAISRIKLFADDIVLWIKSIPEAIGAIFDSFFGSGFSSAFSTFFASLGTNIKLFADDVVIWMKSIPEAIGAIFNSFFGGGGGGGILASVKIFISNVLSSFKLLVDGIQRFFTLIDFASFLAAIKLAVNSVVEYFSGFFTIILGGKTTIGDFITIIGNLGKEILTYFSTETIGKISILILETMAIAKTSIGDAALGFFDGLKEAFNDVLAFFTTFKLPNIFEAFEIPESVKAILRFAGIDVGETIATAATGKLAETGITPPPLDSTEWTNAGTTGGTNIATGVADGFNTEVNNPGFFANAKTALADTWDNMWESHSPSVVAAETMGLPIAQGIALGILTGLTDAELPEMFTLLYDTIMLVTNVFTTNYLDKFIIFAATMNVKYTAFSVSILAIINAMYLAIITSTNLFKDAFIVIGGLTVEGFLAKFITLGEQLVALINTAFTTVAGTFDEETEVAYVTGYSIGQMFATGIARGIDDSIPGLIHTVKQMIAAALAAAKAALNSNSPSKVTEKQIGMPFGQGVEVGITKSFNDVDNTLRKRLANMSGSGISAPGMRYNTNMPMMSKGIGGMNNSNLQRSIQAANQTSNVSNSARNYTMNLTVTPERATRVIQNFSVAEFLSI